MGNEMRKQIDKIKSFGKFLNENVDKNDVDIFNVGDIISYNYKYTAKITNVHDDADLLDIILFHPNAAIVTTETTVSSSLCIKFNQA